MKIEVDAWVKFVRKLTLIKYDELAKLFKSYIHRGNKNSTCE